MDLVQGELLIYKVRDNPQIERKTLFEWIRQLLEQLLQYHRCHNNQNYRYLNPYSVLVTKEGKILLLDLEAESNEFVLHNLQKRAMRTHFVKPVVHIMDGAGERLDLHGYGKTLQFILANTKVEPSLSRSQENKLEKIIEKCLNENPGKQYKELKQIEKELPITREGKLWEEKKNQVFTAVAAASLITAVMNSLFVYDLKQEQQNIKGWIWKVEQQNDESGNMKEEEIQELLSDVEANLREEIEIAKEGVKAVNESLTLHINEEKEKEEQRISEENIEAEQKDTDETESTETKPEAEAAGEENTP